MKTEDYQKPKVCSKFTVSEPVETGCCLRSCGGTPFHMGREDLISKDTKKKFEEINQSQVSNN